MASDKSGRTPRHSFDIATVEKLIGLMTANELTEIDLHDGDNRIRLRRGGNMSVVQAVATPIAQPMSAPAAHASSSPVAHAPGTPEKKYHMIVSPTPGTFYAKPSPEEQPYVKVGSKVAPDTVVCKIEAMKIFNDIVAECTGTIVEILVDNAQPVEYGQPLFKVDIG